MSSIGGLTVDFEVSRSTGGGAILGAAGFPDAVFTPPAPGTVARQASDGQLSSELVPVTFLAHQRPRLLLAVLRVVDLQRGAEADAVLVVAERVDHVGLAGAQPQLTDAPV